MKKTIFILILIAGICTGVSFQIGRVIEAELPTVLDRVAELGQIQISITSYDRNIFRSTVKSAVTLPSISGQLEKIHLKHEIWHGPLPFGKSSDGQIHFKPMSALVETKVDKENPPTGLIGEFFSQCPELYASIELTRFDFAGNGASAYNIPGFEKSFGENDDSLLLKWQGLNGTANIDKSMKNIKGMVSVPNIRLSNQKSRLETGEIKSSFRIFEDFGGLLLGNVTVDVATIDIIDGKQKTAFKDFQFRNAAKLDNDTVSYSIAIGIETVQAGDQSYGPAGLELDFVRLDAATILKVQKRLQTIQSEIKTISEEAISGHIFTIYAEALPALIEKNPEIKLNYLNLRSPDGEFWTKGNIVFENPKGQKIHDLNSLLSTIKAKSDSQISKTLLQNFLTTVIKGQLNQAREAGQLGDLNNDQFNAMASGAAAEQLAKLQADGSIVDEGNNYRAEFSFKNQRTTLNGRPLSIQ